MGVLIQLIIILVIIASVMKRFREIAAKSRDLEKGQLPKPVIDLFGNGSEEPEEERPSWQHPEPQPETRQDMMPESWKETPPWEEPQPVGTDSTFDEDRFESRTGMQVSESSFREGMTADAESLQEIRAKAERLRAARYDENMETQKPHMPVLWFGRNQVVRGIVMSEILGPPVALRDRERFISGIV